MESRVIFRDYQEQQAQDHNDLQVFTQRSFDHLTLDAVTAERRYAGFTCIKSGQAEVEIQPGRMYDVLGVVYALNSTTTQSMVSYLTNTFERYMLLTAVGNDVETDIEERDYLIDVTTGATEPRAVATTRSRIAVLTWTQGVEAAEPSKPAVPFGHVAIAYIRCDVTQVVSVEMVESNRVTSTDSLDLRVDACELFDSIIGPRVSALASDLADLRNRVNALGTQKSIQAIAMDVARLKASLKYPSTAADYDTDWFLDVQDSDSTNTLTLGYDAKIEEGCRFPDANADQFEIGLFSANDPNAALHASGLLLPKYTEVMRLATSTAPTTITELGIAQYGYQVTNMKLGYMSRSRMRYGGSFYECTNSAQWDNNDLWGSITRQTNDFFVGGSVLYPDGAISTRISSVGQIWYSPNWDINFEVYRTDNYWFDTWNEPFMYAVTTDLAITGAFIAQTFLVPNDIWATSLWIYVTAKGANEDIHISMCDTRAGVPDLDRTFMHTVYAHTNIVAGWNKIAITPTFLRKGGKFALVFISNANHKVGMVSGQEFLDGTFFYSTDGIYFHGDLTQDLLLQIWGARFNNSQVTIEFGAINLDGGFRHVDLLAEMWVPDSAHIYWEMRPNGVGDWQPLIRDNTEVLALAPTLAYFRARFDGTRDMQAGVMLAGSRLHVSRPKLAFTHVSKPIDLTTPCQNVVVTCVLEAFDETPHDHTLIMRTGATLATIETPDATVTKLTDLARRAYERKYTFNLPATVTHLCFVQTGTTNSPQQTFHVAERTFYAY
jgi:hypothetical protein